MGGTYYEENQNPETQLTDPAEVKAPTPRVGGAVAEEYTEAFGESGVSEPGMGPDSSHNDADTDAADRDRAEHTRRELAGGKERGKLEPWESDA
ncbi:hypothetical protein [Serinibacter salmoneus]|uniref:Uncharacterized protein n=1 Tax=Serinibacter salmoneus TaxID=556530 RepID=A0A2A9D3L0_9MICO|nr:hypothetical protein [Serinibacter salmoneus]PFG20926.1 hypothetical protein ATL40_2543 [Serinibacter salmoneus]